MRVILSRVDQSEKKDLMLVQQKAADLGYFIHSTKENIDNNR